MAPDANDDLAQFELPAVLLEPLLRSLRLTNTLLDTAFYDVGVLATELLWRGSVVITEPGADRATTAQSSFAKLDLGALSNPEGCLLVVDAGRAPYVTRFDTVDSFLAWAGTAGQDVATATITGVGSSALGSAALAWNASMALDERVVAIVPGYGIADVVGQALGGWFGFGLHDYLARQSQQTLATVAPSVARVGHKLLATTPGHAAAATDAAPTFRTGSGASDVLHALLGHAPGLKRVIGHSKGALAIANALRSLDDQTTRRLHVVTFGCPIGEEVPVASYRQFLGTFDVLGQLNAWGHRAEVHIPTHHSTNTTLPFSMPVALCLRALPPEEDAIPQLASPSLAADAATAGIQRSLAPPAVN